MIKFKSSCAIFLLVQCIGLSKAFVVPSTSHLTSYTFTSFKLKLQNDNDDPDIAMERNIQRTCVRNFLTQRSIQSFMFLAEQVRDPHTADWIERLLGQADLLNFHGTGALNFERFPAWDSFFKELIQQPKTTIIVQAKRRGRGHGGWSKNNPYLKVCFFNYIVSMIKQIQFLFSS